MTKNLLILVAMITAATIVGCPQKSEPKAVARYTVTFDKNHADAKGSMDPQTYEAGVEQKLTPNLFDLTNHDFKGWATSPEGDKKYIDQQSITINTNMTLYAVWEEKICTITFNKNADDAVGTMYSQIIENGIQKKLSENKFTRPNFKFLGWATSPDGEKVYDDKSEITVKRSIELYAVWERNIVYVTFDKNDANASGEMNTQNFGAGVPQSLNINAFEKEGYHITGWATSPDGEKVYEDGESITITSNITLYAIWEINKYTVAFDANGGTGTMEPQVFSHGIAQNLIKNTFARKNYTFVGWATSADGEKIYNNEASFTTTSDTTLYAVWEELNKYTVAFNSNRGTGTMDPQIFRHGVEQKLTKNTFTRNNYTFVGWATSTDGEKVYDDEASFTTTSDTTLYAVWELNKYTVTFNKNGGTRTMEPQIFTHGVAQNLRANNFSRTGYTFSGWATSADGEKVYENRASFTTTSDTTLYAVWEPNKYTVTFNANGGTGTMKPQVFSYGVAQKLTQNAFAHENYTFVGWATSANGAKVYKDSEQIKITSNTTLYAVWELNKYTVTFNSNGGSGTMYRQVFTHDERQKLTKNTFTRKNYTFIGWSTSPDGKKVYKDEAWFKTTSDITLYAVWLSFETYMTFGEFPQTIKSRYVTVYENQSKEVGMFTYYKGSDGAWYVKQEEKAYDTGDAYKYSDGTKVAQASAGTTKYFKVEPIKWRVLDEEYGKKFLLAEDGLMAVQYHNSTLGPRVIGVASNVPADNYAYSKIRAWLNGYSYAKATKYLGSAGYETESCTDYDGKGFFQTAFTSTEHGRISYTFVVTSGYGAVSNNKDKVFLLSREEATSYGFDITEDNKRIRKPTDFALATGAFNYGGSYGGNWWLRKYGARTSAPNIRYDGRDAISEEVNSGKCIVVPALWIYE